jgi:hypothetical protein
MDVITTVLDNLTIVPEVGKGIVVSGPLLGSCVGSTVQCMHYTIATVFQSPNTAPRCSMAVVLA